MSSRLFHSVVVSSALMLAGASISGCASVVVSVSGDLAVTEDAAPAVTEDAAPAVTEDAAPALTEDAAPPDAAEPVDAPTVDAATVSDDAAVDDHRTTEIGWPTTKGVSCTNVDGGVSYCCRGVRVDGRPTACCIPHERLCTVCEVDERGVCVPVEATDGGADD
ncbi:MAG: hypothetical protein U0326_17105 [Polyangiales bacterium]